MIQPRKSDGIVDLEISSLPRWIWQGILARKWRISAENHLYRWCGPDIFLPGNNGQSNRKAEHYFLNGKLAAVLWMNSSITS